MLRPIPPGVALTLAALVACAPSDANHAAVADSGVSSVAPAGPRTGPVAAVDRSAFAELGECPVMRAVEIPSTTLDTLSILHCPSKELGAQPAVAAGYFAIRVDETQGITITMAATEASKSHLDPMLVLYTAAGAKVVQDDTSGGGLGGYDARISRTLAAGVYVIEAAASYAGSGPYTLTVAK